MPFSAVFTSVSVPVNIIVASAVPSPVINARPAVVLSVIVPLVAVKVILIGFAPASESATEIWLPLPLEKTNATSSLVFCGPGTVLTGPSLTPVTLMVMVLGVGSRSVPAPASCTWKVNDVYGVPKPSGAGVNFNRPAVMSATETNSPALTATLLFVSVPRPGNVVIFTARNVFGGVSFGSVNPKSAAVNV